MTSPVDRFLLGLLPPTAGREESLRGLTERPGFDWRRLEQRAVRWGLAPLVHFRLEKAGLIDRAPEAVISHLARIRQYTAVRNSLIDRELERIASAFESASLPMMLLKGADLMRTVYPHPSLRISLDLDLLVGRDVIDRADDLMRGLAYTPATAMDREWFDENLHHGVPWKSANGIVVELHWTLVRKNDPFHVDVAGLWERALPVAIGRAAALRLSAADGAEYLAVHFFRHLTAPDGAFRSFADLALLLEAPEGRAIDWEVVRAGARRRGTTLPLALVLSLLNETWPERGLNPPVAGLEADLGDGRLIARSRRLLDNLFHLPSHQPPAIVSGLTRLGQESGVARKAAFLAGGLFPRPAYVNRDLTRGQTRWPVALRYPMLALNYFMELLRLGPRGALVAYRLGQLRGAMTRSLPRDVKRP